MMVFHPVNFGLPRLFRSQVRSRYATDGRQTPARHFVMPRPSLRRSGNNNLWVKITLERHGTAAHCSWVRRPTERASTTDVDGRMNDSRGHVAVREVVTLSARRTTRPSDNPLRTSAEKIANCRCATDSINYTRSVSGMSLNRTASCWLTNFCFLYRREFIQCY